MGCARGWAYTPECERLKGRGHLWGAFVGRRRRWGGGRVSWVGCRRRRGRLGFRKARGEPGAQVVNVIPSLPSAP